MGSFQDQIMRLFKTEDYSKPKRVKTTYESGKKPNKSKIQKLWEKNIIKNIRNLFKSKTENEAIKDRIIIDIQTLLEQEDDYYKTIRVSSFWNSNYIEYERNADGNKNLSVK